ncbi:Dickkopf N-terminal cysteine-rich domain-containing protein [Leclercia adecarboxylata]
MRWCAIRRGSNACAPVKPGDTACARPTVCCLWQAR